MPDPPTSGVLTQAQAHGDFRGRRPQRNLPSRCAWTLDEREHRRLPQAVRNQDPGNGGGAAGDRICCGRGEIRAGAEPRCQRSVSGCLAAWRQICSSKLARWQSGTSRAVRAYAPSGAGPRVAGSLPAVHFAFWRACALLSMHCGDGPTHLTVRSSRGMQEEEDSSNMYRRLQLGSEGPEVPVECRRCASGTDCS